MKHQLGIIAVISAVLLIVAALVLVAEPRFLVQEVWERENPLVNPVAVRNVHDGVLTLDDGRLFRPAGIRRPPELGAAEYDTALRVMVAQGVVVSRDLGDGSAMLTAEPRFYNWCGTAGYKGRWWAHLAGSYLRCPLSELMIFTSYALPDLEQPSLTAHERWRLEGVTSLGDTGPGPVRISLTSNAIRSDPRFHRLDSEFEGLLELLWKAPPER